MSKRVRGADERRPIYEGKLGLVARAIDGAIGMVAPGLAHRMSRARMQREALLAFQAARITRIEPSSPKTSADSNVLPDLDRLRDKSRILAQDDPHVIAAVDITVECTIGDGIVPRGKCTPAETGLSEEDCRAWNDACTAEFARWSDEESDATGVGTFYDLQELTARELVVDGESFSHALPGGDGMIAVETIDADRVVSPGMYDTYKVRAGVELDGHGRRVAYHVLPAHPQDVGFAGAPNTTVPVRIEAEAGGLTIMTHVFWRRRTGQTRGYPHCSGSANFLGHLREYLYNETVAQRTSAGYALFIKRAISPTDVDVLPVQDTEDGGADLNYLEKIEPGTIEYLNEGEEVQPFAPNRPGTQFEAFVTRILRASASSMGLSYEVMCRDFGRMNLSSARAMLREVRRRFDRLRALIVRGFCQPWWRNVIQSGIVSGRLQPPGAYLDNPEAFLRAQWTAPAYGFVDPVSDAEGSTAAVSANLTTPQEEAAAQGRDAIAVLRERADFLRQAKDLEEANGLTPGALTTPANAQRQAAMAADQANQDQPAAEPAAASNP